MDNASLLTVLLILWAAVTVAFLAVMAVKSLTGLREEDTVILDPAEDRRAAEQQAIVARVERLTMWAKRFGLTSAALLVLAGGVWIYRAMLAFNGQLTQ
jgi:hypothetical protein